MKGISGNAQIDNQALVAATANGFLPTPCADACVFYTSPSTRTAAECAEKAQVAAAAHTYKIMASDKTSELPFWFEIVKFLQDQDMGHVLLWPAAAAVKGIADVMRYTVRRLQQEQHLISIAALDAVVRGDPCCILKKATGTSQSCLRQDLLLLLL